MATTNHPDHAWRKYFYTGISFATHSKDILQRSMEEFVKHGQLNEAEGKKIVDSALQKLEEGYNETIHKLATLSTAETSKLKGRIAKLEKQLSVSKTGRKAPATSVLKKAKHTISTKKKAMVKKAAH